MDEFQKWKFKLWANLGNKSGFRAKDGSLIFKKAKPTLGGKLNWGLLRSSSNLDIQHRYVEWDLTQQSGKGAVSKTLTLRADRRHHQVFLHPFNHLKASSPPSIALWITLLNAPGKPGSGPSAADWLLATIAGEVNYEWCCGCLFVMFGSELCLCVLHSDSVLHDFLKRKLYYWYLSHDY